MTIRNSPPKGSSINRMEAILLILTRRVGKSLIIDEDVEVSVIGAKGNQVRIGIDTPADVTILREELLDDGEELREVVTD